MKKIIALIILLMSVNAYALRGADVLNIGFFDRYVYCDTDVRATVQATDNYKIQHLDVYVNDAPNITSYSDLIFNTECNTETFGSGCPIEYNSTIRPYCGKYIICNSYTEASIILGGIHIIDTITDNTTKSAYVSCSGNIATYETGSSEDVKNFNTASQIVASFVIIFFFITVLAGLQGYSNTANGGHRR